MTRYCPNCDRALERFPEHFTCFRCSMTWDVRHAYALPTAPLDDEALRASWQRAAKEAGLR